jgi:DNA invertase Pin-like site-specific DNA recombinase
MKVKYIRWSTLNQTSARQMADAKDYDLVIQEQIGGSTAFAKRPKGQEVLELIKSGVVTDLYVEEFSRLGRNAYDTLTTLNICEENKVNVHIQNMNLDSYVKGKPNPLFKMFSYMMSVIAEQEREQIKERTEAGKQVARQKGVVFGRKTGTNERKVDFLNKENNKKILKYLATGDNTIREISKLTDTSTRTITKVKKVALELNMLQLTS